MFQRALTLSRHPAILGCREKLPDEADPLLENEDADPDSSWTDAGWTEAERYSGMGLDVGPRPVLGPRARGGHARGHCDGPSVHAEGVLSGGLPCHR
jgi:hypothetical protein